MGKSFGRLSKMQKLICQPIKLRSMTLKNRMVMPPMVVRYASEDGFVTDRTVDYYETRSKGGAGLIIQEATYVSPNGQILANEPGISDDRFIPGLSRVAEAIHRHGAKAAVQLVHGGRLAFFRVPGGKRISASALAAPGYPAPSEMTKADIDEVVNAFAQAAYRAMCAGYDGVEVHAAHGYLVDQFISPASNKRTDSYGGSVNNRARLLLEVIGAIKEAVGKNFPVWCRLNGKEFGIEYGETLEDAKKVARLAEEAGVVAIHVSATGVASPIQYPTYHYTPGTIVDLAAGIKEAVHVPVIAVGRMTPELGEKLIEEGKADLIAFGRALFADPEIPNKVCFGNEQEIRPCILCFCCRDGLRNPHEIEIGLRCGVNAAMGREGVLEITPAEKPKKVLVVGGGPAGMEAARVAAIRGHKVTLWEKADKLGGQLIPASAAPYKDRVGALPLYYAAALKDSRVRVVLNREATAAKIKRFKPDTVILATGVKSIMPQIPGLDKARHVNAVDMLTEKHEVVGKNFVIVGGELVACEVAQYLTGRGKKATMVRRGPEIAQKVSPSLKPFLLNNLKNMGITTLTGVTYNEANEKGLVITTKEGQKELLPADVIVIAAGAEPDRELYQELKDTVPTVMIVGDCVSPRNIPEAVADGYRAGLNI